VFIRREDGDYVLRVGESDVTTLSLELFNSGEDAHDTTLSVTLPDDDVDYLGTDSHVRYYYTPVYYYCYYCCYCCYCYYYIYLFIYLFI